MRPWLAATLMAAASGCRFDEALPAGARVPCSADKECPTGNQCDEGLALCVASASPFTLTAPVRPSRGRAGDVFRLALSSAELLGELVVVALDGGGREVGAFAFSVETGQWSWTATGEEPEGRLRVFASTTGGGAGLGAVNLVELGGFELDFTAPRALTTSLRVVPEASNALVANGFPALVASVGPGAAVEATFELSEPVQGLPVVTLLAADAGFPLEVSSTGAIFRSLGVLPSQSPEGTWTAQLEVADSVGNRSTLELGTLEVRTTPPAPPSVDLPGRVLYHRAPWGTIERQQPRYSLTGEPGAAPGAVAVVVGAGPYLIGRAPVSADGSFDVSLLLEGDVPSVQVRSLDAAGNVSVWVEVLDVEWTISALTADAGSLRQSAGFDPFGGAWQAATWVRGTPWRAAGSFQVKSPNLGAATRLATTRQGVRGNGVIWNRGRELVSHGSNNYTVEACRTLQKTVVYDLERDRWYCTGNGSGLPLPDGGVRFDPRVGARAVWVPPAHRVLVLGGAIADVPEAGGFWFDGRVQGEVEPVVPARVGHVMEWDPRRRQVLIFGGLGVDGGLLEDTWVWADGGFAELAGASPPARAGANLAWDDLGERLVLAGGVLQDGSAATDTWVHDGRAWAPLDAGAYAGRVNASFSASADPSVLLLLGGTALDGGVLRDSDGGVLAPAAFEGGRWASLSAARDWNYGVQPSIGYHPQLGVVAVGGGQTDESCGEYDCDTYLRLEPTGLWVWRDWGWHELADAGSPSTVGGRLGWSRSTNELVLHQGRTFVGPGAELLGTLVVEDWRRQHRWNLDGGWRVVDLADAGAPPVANPLTYFDEAADRLLIHGGRRADGGGESPETWEQRADGTWGLLELGPTRLLSYGPVRWARGREPTSSVVSGPGGTWSFDGRWSPMPAAPSVLLSQHPVSGSPASVGRGVSIWDGSAWVPEPLAQLPDLTDSQAGLQLDPATGQIIVAGAGPSSVLDYGAGQPTQLFAVPLTRATAATDALLRAVSFRAKAGGRGTGPDGGVVAGAQLLLRLDGKLVPVGQTCTGTVSAPADCGFSVTDPELLARWLLRDTAYQPDVEIGLTSLGPNGRATEAQVLTMGLEFSVTYRRDGGVR